MKPNEDKTDYSRLIKAAESLKAKPVSTPAETKKNKYPAEYYDAAERTLNVLNSSFSKREFLKFAIQTSQSLPFIEFGIFFDFFVKDMEAKGRIKIHPAAVYDYETYSKTNFVPAAPKDEIEILSSTEDLTKNVVSKY